MKIANLGKLKPDDASDSFAIVLPRVELMHLFAACVHREQQLSVAVANSTLPPLRFSHESARQLYLPLVAEFERASEL